MFKLLAIKDSIIIIFMLLFSYINAADDQCDCGWAQPGPLAGGDPDNQPELPTVRKIAQGYLPHR